MPRTETTMTILPMQELSIEEAEQLGFDVDEWSSMF